MATRSTTRRRSGTDGADALTGGAGDDSLSGGAGADTLTGGAGLDTLRGGDGDDVLRDGPGRVALYGGDGDDRIELSGAGLRGVVDGGAGADSVRVAGSLGTLRFVGVETLRADGALSGTAAQFSAFSSIVRADGKTGAVSLALVGGGALDLSAALGARAAALDLSDVAARVVLGGGADTVRGGAGDDVIDGAGGRDSLSGGGGNDLLRGGAGDDVLSGGDGADRIVDAQGRLAIDAGAGADRIEIGAEAYGVVNGGAGADSVTIDGALGTARFLNVETLLAGGSITATAAQLESFDVIRNAADPTGTVFLMLTTGGVVNLSGELDARGSWAKLADVPTDFTFGDGADLGFGGAAGDTMRGGGGGDTLYGLGGNDALEGDAGADSLVGQDGRDTLTGGAGSDTLAGGDLADTFVFAAAAHSTLAARDTISDFQTGLDRIDLRALWSGTIVFRGEAAFTETAGEARFSDGALLVDLDGDGAADLAVTLAEGATVASGDLLL